MNHDSKSLPSVSSHRHTFILIDELPGPSVGDAADHLEQLGLDPWQFDEILQIDDFADEKMIAVTFAAIGPQKLIEALNTAIQKTLSHSS